MSAEDVLRWAWDEFGERMCLTCSWQRQSSVLVHMVSELGLRVPVVELDTQLFFRETYETRDRLVERDGLRPERPHAIPVPQQAVREGPKLSEANPARFCPIRTGEPVQRPIAPDHGGIPGLRPEPS